ncbi:MAG: AmpG family muropeptide MFS transporter [Bacteroidales bacterium]|nr:AmpG family muropeptide MFS transporter [Bacteroidales bacterium]
MTNKEKSPWIWIPSLYFAQGTPYVVVMTVAIIMYKRLGISNADITLYTGWLYLPWVIKPFWSPLVDMFKTKRWWIVTMQLVIGAGLAGVALTLPGPNYFKFSLLFFWLLAFSSATHDIAVDGFYMLGLDEGKQAYFIGIRSTFYRIAVISGQGILIILAGYLEKYYDNIRTAWSITFAALALLFLILFLYHKFILPRPASDKALITTSGLNPFSEFLNTFLSFFRKESAGLAVSFMLIFRLGEAQLVKMASPFLLDPREVGGLGLSTSEIGLVYGTIGIIALTLGGIIGGIAASNKGLKHWFYPMALALNLPNAVYVYMAVFQPESIWVIGALVAIEQLGYGFGFTAFMLYLIYFSEGENKTAHYAICTGIMALGMMIPGVISGWLQEMMGYSHFFTWVLLCSIPGLIIIRYLKVDPVFGIKKKSLQSEDT